MKHMKKLFALLLVCALMGTFLGCSDDTGYATRYTRDAAQRTTGERQKPTYPSDIRTTTKYGRNAEAVRRRFGQNGDQGRQICHDL